MVFSLWKQSRGTAIDGKFDGETLSVLPASILTYDAFERAHPDGLVLDRTDAKSEAASDTDEPAAIDYKTDPYAEYAQRPGSVSVHTAVPAVVNGIARTSIRRQ